MNIKPYIRKANYYETDQMGIIHHSNYVRWFEEARVDFMEQIGYPYNKVSEIGIDFAVLSVHCEYKSMVRFNDTVHINVSASEIKEATMTLNYEIVDPVTGKMRTSGYTSHCFYDNNKKRPVSLQKALPELYELFNQFTRGKSS